MMSNFELLKSIIIPIATFILGFIVNRIFTWHDKRKQISNIRSILIKEMVENYKELIRFVPKKESEEAGIGSLQSAVDNISSSVYDNYLGRICELDKEEVEYIYEAYNIMKVSIRIIHADRIYITPESLMKYDKKCQIACNNTWKNYKRILIALKNALAFLDNNKEVAKLLDENPLPDYIKQQNSN